MTPLQRWLKGLSIVLEKTSGKIDVKKLRDILLLEEEFNSLHKIIFNTRVILQLESDHLKPQEIIGSRTSQYDIKLDVRKNLIADTFN